MSVDRHPDRHSDWLDPTLSSHTNLHPRCRGAGTVTPLLDQFVGVFHLGQETGLRIFYFKLVRCHPNQSISFCLWRTSLRRFDQLCETNRVDFQLDPKREVEF